MDGIQRHRKVNGDNRFMSKVTKLVHFMLKLEVKGTVTRNNELLSWEKKRVVYAFDSLSKCINEHQPKNYRRDLYTYD